MSRPTVLVVDDDTRFAARLGRALDGLFHVDLCHSEEEFRERFAVSRYDLLIVDMRLDTGREGLTLLREVISQDAMQPVVVMTAYADLATYSDALEAGALTYLDKSEFSPTLIARTVEAIVRQGQLQRRLAAMEHRLERIDPMEIIGASPAIREVRERLRRDAENEDRPVLLVGEPGTGKELVARNIHRLAHRRAERPFVLAPCGRFNPAEVEVRLFGSVRRHDASRHFETRGWVDEAKGGVLLIDCTGEIGEATLVKLAQLVGAGTFSRAGSRRQIEADTRVVMAAVPESEHQSVFQSLQRTLQAQRVEEIHVPPLRACKEDIPLLAQYALQNLFRRGKSRARSFKGAVLATLESLPWPGNVRELNGAIQYAAVRADAERAPEIGPEHLPQSVSEVAAPRTDTSYAVDYRLHLARSEVALLESAIDQFETTKKGELAARLRYPNRYTFARRIRRDLEAYPNLRREFPNTARLFAREIAVDDAKSTVG